MLVSGTPGNLSLVIDVFDEDVIRENFSGERRREQDAGGKENAESNEAEEPRRRKMVGRFIFVIARC